jgi:lipid II:glycine glycyltransferase (peptidoglycan interpeptide bridge formation enzyme)
MTSLSAEVVTAAAEAVGERGAGRALREDGPAWDAFVAAAPGGSFPQLTAWAEANTTKGWRSIRVVEDAPGGPVGAQLLLHRMRPGLWSRAYAPRGPIAKCLDAAALAAFTGALRERARSERLSHVLVDPEVERGGPAEDWLRTNGWRPAGEIQINRTRVIDLRRPEAALWSDLRSSARWSVNKARRSGSTVEEAGADGLDDFERLYLATARRVGFAPGAAFRAVYHAFARRGAGRLLVCRGPAGEAAATLMLLDCGDRVIELYGASSSQGAAARANYLIKWEAIRASRERGMASYDMWGTDQEGLATFKASFGGTERTYVGAWELVTNPRAYALLQGARRAQAALGSLSHRLRGKPARRASPASAPAASDSAPTAPRDDG